MTDREKAIVTAYTGVTMLTGDKLSIFHKYIEDICGRPIWTHELASVKVWEEIKEKSRNDFLKICATSDEPERQYFPPCEDCHKKMDDIRKTYDKAMARPQGEALFVLNHLFYDCDNMTQKEYDILLEAIKEADMRKQSEGLEDD